jgi:hypothetical protein
VLVVAALTASLCVSALAARVAAADGLSVPDVVKETNAVRSRNGLVELAIDPRLTRAAQAKADDMAARGYFAHQTPDGRMPWDWIASAGYDFLAAAENLAVGYPSDAAVVAAWMASEGHRHNLLNQKYSDVGIGIARGKYKGQDTVFVVQLFGKPRPDGVRTLLRARAIPFGVFLPPAVPLQATDLSLAQIFPPAVPLDATPIPLGPAGLPSVALEASGIPFGLVPVPGVALEATPLLLTPCLPPAMPLQATNLRLGPSKLPAGVRSATARGLLPGPVRVAARRSRDARMK